MKLDESLVIQPKRDQTKAVTFACPYCRVACPTMLNLAQDRHCSHIPPLEALHKRDKDGKIEVKAIDAMEGTRKCKNKKCGKRFYVAWSEATKIILSVGLELLGEHTLVRGDDGQADGAR